MRILLFAHLRDAAGHAELTMRFDRRVDAEQLWQRLIAWQPVLAPFRTSVRLARNGEYARPGERFDDGDEVALIPPVSGG